VISLSKAYCNDIELNLGMHLDRIAQQEALLQSWAIFQEMISRKDWKTNLRLFDDFLTIESKSLI
jgi:hypothetical protein